ncbi:MAG: hypothetical protein QOE26_1445 [Verrucomicrobiota bacterium]
MVRQSVSIADQLIAVCAADETIQQTITVNVTRLFPPKKETDSSETMDTNPHIGPSSNLRFDFANRPETRRMKQAGRAEQQGVENLRRAGNLCEPAQFSNDKREYHKSIIASARAACSAGR